MKMRVLHVVFSLEPGGMENGVVNLARRLDGDIQTDICCLKRSGSFAKRLPASSRVFVLDKREGFDFRVVAGLRKRIEEERPHVLHTHNLGPLLYACAANICGASVPILHGEHGSLIEHERQPSRLMVRRGCYAFCGAIHSVAFSLTNELATLGLPTGGVTTIQNGVDTDRFHPPETKTVAKADVGLPEDSLIFGIVGRFDRDKRHGGLIAAFNRVAGACPRMRLVFLGEGGTHEKEVLAAVSASPAKERIHLAGYQEDMPAWYRAMDVVALPSVREGMSNVVLEAMASGVPVMANETSGCSEIMTDGADGFLRALATDEALADALQFVYERDLVVPQYGMVARETILARFSLRKMVAEYRALYRRLAV